MTQKQRISEYMDSHNGITNKEAYDHLGVARLAARIAEMIDAGEKIMKTTETSKNRYGETVRYTRYKKAV